MPTTKEAARPTLARATGPRKTNPSLSYHPRPVGASLQMLPPADIDAEQHVLSALASPYALDVLAALPDWPADKLFTHGPHVRLFNAIQCWRADGDGAALEHTIKSIGAVDLAPINANSWTAPAFQYWTARLLSAARLRRVALGADCLSKAAQAGDLEGVRRIVAGIVAVLEETPCKN